MNSEVGGLAKDWNVLAQQLLSYANRWTPYSGMLIHNATVQMTVQAQIRAAVTLIDSLVATAAQQP